MRTPLLLAYTLVSTLALIALAGPLEAASPCSPDDVAACKAACEKKDDEACFALAGFHGRGQGVKKDTARMAALLSASCRRNHARSCAEMGFLLEHGVGVKKKDPEGARSMYEKACKAGHQPACVNLGTALEARAAKGDLNRAAELYRDACAVGEATGCFNAGNLYRMAGAADRAAEWYTKGCEGGDAAACYNLAVQYRTGDGVDEDLARARTLMKKACDGGEKKACGGGLP